MASKTSTITGSGSCLPRTGDGHTEPDLPMPKSEDPAKAATWETSSWLDVPLTPPPASTLKSYFSELLVLPLFGSRFDESDAPNFADS